MSTAKKVDESDDQGVVHVDVPIGRPGQRVEVLVVWEDVGESDGLDHERSGMAPATIASADVSFKNGFRAPDTTFRPLKELVDSLN